jgi:hypothetical protein
MLSHLFGISGIKGVMLNLKVPALGNLVYFDVRKGRFNGIERSFLVSYDIHLFLTEYHFRTDLLLFNKTVERKLILSNLYLQSVLADFFKLCDLFLFFTFVQI